MRRICHVKEIKPFTLFKLLDQYWYVIGIDSDTNEIKAKKWNHTVRSYVVSYDLNLIELDTNTITCGFDYNDIKDCFIYYEVQE